VIGSRVLFFALFFLLALMNSQDINFHWFVNQSIQIPLMFVILGAFLMGMILSGFAFYRLNPKKSGQ
jgi:uncharacterized integral membrane protein